MTEDIEAASFQPQGSGGNSSFHPDDTVNLNVGGTKYTTTVSTLTRYPDSMLGAMFSGRHPVKEDKDGCYFIEGDGQLFRYVLHYLRRSRLVLPESNREIEMLIGEADFYQIEPMIKEIEMARPGEEEILDIELCTDSCKQQNVWVVSGRPDILESFTVNMVNHDTSSYYEPWKVTCAEQNLNSFIASKRERISITRKSDYSDIMMFNERSEIFSQVLSLGFKEVPVINRVSHQPMINRRLCCTWRFRRSVKKGVNHE